MKYLYLIFLTLFSSFNYIKAIETGNPFVKYYHPVDYMGYSQNWDVTQDKYGIMYFANGDGLLEYDGKNWKLFKVGRQNTPTSLYIDDKNQIWVGGTGEIGYFIRDNLKGLEYFSLSQFIPEAQKDFTFILKIIETESGIYYQTYDKIFYWDYNELNVIEFDANISMYKIHNNIIIWVENSGFNLIEDGKVKVIIKNRFFADKPVSAILENDHNLYTVVTRRDGVYSVLFNFKNDEINSLKVIKKKEFPGYDFASKNNIHYVLKMNNGNIAIATMYAGTVLMNDNGKILKIFNRSTKIPNETHTKLCEDKEGNLWITMDNGIAKVAASVNVTYLDDGAGLLGSVLDIKKYKNYLFAGTWQGLFFLDIESAAHTGKGMKFNSFEQIKSQCWKIKVIKFNGSTYIAVASSSGLFIIDENMQIQHLYDGQYFEVFQSSIYPDYVFVGQRGVVSVFSYNKKGISKYCEINLPSPQNLRVMSINEDNDSNIWVGVEKEGVYKLLYNKNKSDRMSCDFSFDKKNYIISDEPLYNYLYNISAHLFLPSRDGLYIKTTQNGEIVFKKFFGKYNSFIFRNYYINMLHYDKNNHHIWMQISSKSSARKLLVKLHYNDKNRYTFMFNRYLGFPPFEVHSIYADKDNYIWLGCDDGVFCIDDNEFISSEKELYTHIKKVLVNQEVVFNSVLTDFDLFFDAPVKLKQGNKSIVFHFSSSLYYNEDKRSFRFILEGFDKDWSGWTQNSSKEYTNLRSGSYRFIVQSKDFYGNYSKPSTFEFYVTPPWYMSMYAYIFYTLILSIIIIFINKYSVKRYEKANLKFEKIIEKRTEEIREQKKATEIEKEKSDKLLLNVLPVKIAEELKSIGFSKTQYFDSATVIFTDFVGFTKIAEKEDPQLLIEKLERFFVQFDEVCIRNKIEKIKTIGDSHMSVAGVPVPNNTHVFDTVLAAIEMMEVVQKVRKNLSWAKEWNLRIGIHTGKVIAGIVGKKKFAFDVWGDTVNTASRLQVTSDEDRINISKQVFDIISPYFECEYRGKIKIKHKGPFNMYFVNRLLPEYSRNESGTKINKNFKDVYLSFYKQK